MDIRRKNIVEIGQKLYDLSHSMLVKHKLLRYGLAQHVGGREVVLAQALQSKWINELQSEQREDGSWGRFHTQASSARQKCETTERAAWRLHFLGIGRGAAIADRLCTYMEVLLNDMSLWPDAWERNKPFQAGVPLFIASKLSIFGSEDDKYRATLNQWISILSAAFANGAYSEKCANDKAKELLGLEVQSTYIALNGINNLLLFSNHADLIEDDVQLAYLQWLHGLSTPIYYTNISLNLRPDVLDASQLQGYLWVLGLASRLKGFPEVFHAELDWLCSQQADDIFWDFGPKLTLLKLSDDWRKYIDRRIDQTAHVLMILNHAVR